MPPETSSENNLYKPVTTPIAALTLGLVTALVFTTTLNGFVGLKQTMNQLAAHQNYAAVSITAKDKVEINNEILTLEPQETNRVIIKFKEGAKLPPGLAIAAEKANLEKAQGLNHILTINGINAEVYEVSEDDTAAEVVQRVLATKGDLIEYSEVDMLVPPTLIPDDTYYSSAWHLPKIEASTAWDSTQGQGAIVAILDTGVDPDHPDLVNNLVPGWNFYDNNADWSDIRGHGTAVAGVAAATTNNGIGVAGIAGQSKIMPLRVTDTVGSGYSSTISQAIVYAADHSIRIANASFQGLTNSLTLRNAAQYMKDKNGLVLVSAGNTGMQENHTVTTTMIPVSATDLYDEKASFSSYGNYVALAAPGNNFYSTRLGGDYIPVAGTSFSSPAAAGVIALIFSANPQLTASEAEAVLFNTADDLGEPGWDMYYGHGRVNAAKAVAAAKAMQGTEDTEAPTTPTNLSISGITDRSATLSWSPSTDNVLVTGYNIYRNGQKLTTTSNTNFTDSSLSANTTYGYTVSALDKAGNESPQSASTTVTTEDIAFNISSYSVTAKTNADATIGVNLTKPGTVTVRYGTTSGNLNLSANSSTINTTHSVNLTGLSSATTYYYQVTATDQNGTTVTSSVSSFKTSKGGGGSGGSTGGGGGKGKNR